MFNLVQVSGSNAIPPDERLIVALDLPSEREALQLVDKLGDTVKFYKVGLELFSSGTGISLIKTLIGRGKRVFADFKFYDVPATVSRAARQLNSLGIDFLTVHAELSVMEAAVEAVDSAGILAVTVLTSFDQHSIESMGFQGNVGDIVLKRARHAYDAGCAGVIASGQEAKSIKAEIDGTLLVVTPGIRKDKFSRDDQKRTVSLSEAFEAGSDYVVVGRPIRDAKNPALAAEEMQSEIQRIICS